MCISFLFANPGNHPIKYKLILINNRDEYYARKTQNATLSTDDDLAVIYGIDLAGAVKGTWLGLSTKSGAVKIGNLANVTGEDVHGRRGRGPIVTDFIKGDDTIEMYNEKLSAASHEFSSFNFLSVEMGDDMKLFYISNTPQTKEQLLPGFIGLGNSPMSAPFKKVDAGTDEFRKILEDHKDSSKTDLVENLMTLLKSKTKHFPDEELTARRQETAEGFSSIHVELPAWGYGTRTRTIILVDEDNNVDYIEETMTSEDPNGAWEKTHLTIPSNKSSPSAQL